MTIDELIKQKSKAFQDIPDKFLSATEKAQKKIFTELTSLLSKLKTNADGTLVVSKENFQLAAKITEELKSVVLGSDYIDAVQEFADGFDKVKTINDKYFNNTFPDFKPSDVTDQILQASKKFVVTDLISSTVDSKFLLPIEKVLTDSIASGAGFQETLKTIRLFVEGGETEAGDIIDGKILRYAKTIAHDSFATSDRSFTNAIADELESEWYLFDGAEVASSRCFCLARKGKYFHYKEIESWANGEEQHDCGFPWSGYREGTNAQTIFLFLGGWGCLDSIMPVSIAIVPKNDIQRNIDNGNFTPSQFEVDELGL